MNNQSQKIKVFIGCTSVLLAISDCSTNHISSTKSNHVKTNPPQLPTKYIYSSPPRQWPNMDWVLSSHVSGLNSIVLPEYANLTMNLGAYGNRYRFNDWHLPPKRKPFLYKNTGPMENGLNNRLYYCLTIDRTIAEVSTLESARPVQA